MQTEDRFLTTAQAAELLGIAPKTLERWRWAGRGPAFRKLGGAVRYDTRDLEHWTESCRRGSTSVPGGPADAAA